MVSETICCPHCSKAEAVVRHGYNRGGTARCRCKQCNKTFTPKPNPRTVTPQKEQSIRDALSERLSMDAIARLLHVSKTTIYNTLKKSPDRSSPDRSSPDRSSPDPAVSARLVQPGA